MFRRNIRAQYQWVRIPEVAEASLGTSKSTTALGVAPTAAGSSVVPSDTELSDGPLPSVRDALAISGLPLSNLSPEDCDRAPDLVSRSIQNRRTRAQVSSAAPWFARERGESLSGTGTVMEATKSVSKR